MVCLHCTHKLSHDGALPLLTCVLENAVKEYRNGNGRHDQSHYVYSRQSHSPSPRAPNNRRVEFPGESTMTESSLPGLHHNSIITNTSDRSNIGFNDRESSDYMTESDEEPLKNPVRRYGYHAPTSDSREMFRQLRFTDDHLDVSSGRGGKTFPQCIDQRERDNLSTFQVIRNLFLHLY